MLYLLLFLSGLSAHAEDVSRMVYNGDILFSTSSTAKTYEEASFMAENGAIHSIIQECTLPHKGIKIWKKDISQSRGNYIATATAGISFEDCEEAKHAQGPRAQKMSNDKIAKDQELYQQTLKRKLGLDKPRNVASKPDHNLKDINDKLDSLNDKLNHQDTPVKEVVVIHEQVHVTNSSKQECENRANHLMQKAQTASMGNFPAGNLAQGAAADYYNEAMEMRSTCPRD